MAKPDQSYPIFLENSIEGSLYPGVPAEVSTYGGPVGTFNSNGAFRATPETERLLNYLETKYGKKITVKPTSEAPGGSDSLPQSIYGVYFGEAPIGGSSDPSGRTVYLNKAKSDIPLPVLSHELGHAFDPNLASNYEAYSRSFPSRTNQLLKTQANKDPVNFLNTFILGPEVKLRNETEAQRAAVQNLQDIGYPTKNFTNDAWYKGYPGSFIDTGLSQAALLSSLPSSVPQGVPTEMLGETRYQNFQSMGGGSPVAFIKRPALGSEDPEIDFTDEVIRNLLDLSLNEKYRRTEESIKDRSRRYIDSRLTP